jgi:hypothetical protein
MKTKFIFTYLCETSRSTSQEEKTSGQAKASAEVHALRSDVHHEGLATEPTL